MEWYAILDIIIRMLLVILLALNAFFLVKMIGRYRKLIRDQDKIIQAEKSDLEFLRSFVEGLKESYKEIKETHEERVKIVREKSEEEKKVMRKELEAKIQTLGKAKQTTLTMAKDIMNLVFLIYRISLFVGAPPIIETYINGMKSTKFAKEEALEAFRKAREETKQLGIGISELTALLLRTPGLFEKAK